MSDEDQDAPVLLDDDRLQLGLHPLHAVAISVHHSGSPHKPGHEKVVMVREYADRKVITYWKCNGQGGAISTPTGPARVPVCQFSGYRTEVQHVR